MTDLSDGYTVGDGVTLSWAPLDTNGAAITGAAAAITLTIKEPGQTEVEKSGGDLTESPAGTYTYTHKITVDGVTRGSWVYDGPGNADGAENFKYYAAPQE